MQYFISMARDQRLTEIQSTRQEWDHLIAARYHYKKDNSGNRTG